MTEQQTRPPQTDTAIERMRFSLAKGDREIDTNDLWMEASDADAAMQLFEDALAEARHQERKRVVEQIKRGGFNYLIDAWADMDEVHVDEAVKRLTRTLSRLGRDTEDGDE